MLLTMMIAGGLFAGLVGILVSQGFQRMGGDVNDEPTAARPSAPAAPSGHCMLCRAPLKRRSTVDQAVFEVEQRIGREIDDVSQLLYESPPERLSRIYQA